MSKVDTPKIAELSASIVCEALDPRRFCDYILNYCDGEARGAIDALRTAIDPRYPDFQKQYARGERGDVETELKVIEEQVKFFIGVAVGPASQRVINRKATSGPPFNSPRTATAHRALARFAFSMLCLTRQQFKESLTSTCRSRRIPMPHWKWRIGID
jgi:hypothetical protein